MPQVIIEHRDGRQYEIASGDFRRGKHHLNPKTGEYETYEAAGFEIVRQADGQPYEPPATRTGESAP